MASSSSSVPPPLSPQQQPEVIAAIPLNSVKPEELVLPEGWTVMEKPRKAGTLRAGYIDRKYQDPENQYIFRSLKTAKAYVKDGTLPEELKSKASSKATTSDSATGQNKRKRKSNAQTAAGEDANKAVGKKPEAAGEDADKANGKKPEAAAA